MKIRADFVTNSSSSSFVIVKKDLPDDIRAVVTRFIEENFERRTAERLLAEVKANCPAVYNLVEYGESDEEMHIWISRDEHMDNEYIDEILYEYDREDIKPKFELGDY